MTHLTLPDGPLAITWRGPMLNLSGYASEMRPMIAGMQARGHEVTAVPLDSAPDFVATSGPAVLGSAAAALRRPLRRGGLLVQHVPAIVAGRPDDWSLVVARTMFETDGLDSSWVRQLNRLDEVWVPTRFNVDTFRAAGVTVPIEVVPGGMEPDRYHPGVAPRTGVRGDRAVCFLSVFEWTGRKGVDVLLRAWAGAFGSGDDVELVLRTYPRGRFPDPAAEIERRVDELLSEAGTDRSRVAPVRVLTDPIAEEDMPGLYTACDVFVLPSRGEGWGRPYLEAMACGRPVIATDWSAHTEFVDTEVGWMLAVDGLATIVEADGAGPHYEGQRWAVPSVDHLVHLFREVAADGAARERKGRTARERARAWSWEPAIDAIEGRVRALDALVRSVPRSTDDAGDGVVESARPVRVLWRGDVLGSHSFARINRETLSRLAGDPRFEIAVRTDEQVVTSPWRDERTATVARLVGADLSGTPDVEVRHGWPPLLTASDATSVVLQQPWEFGGIPDDIAAFAARRDEARPNGADEVWVPTRFVRDCYTDSGVAADRVQVLPHGVDLDIFAPSGPRYPLRTTRRTRLLFVGGTIWRKGVDLLLDTYDRTFTRDDDVCLVVKTSGGSSFYRGSNLDDRIRAMSASEDGPEVEVVADDLTDVELAALYRACDVLVHPFRGEGFGMTLAEAMACGRPVVATGAGAALDILDEHTAVLLPARRRPMTESPAPSSSGAWIYEPDTSALAVAMQRAVEDPIGLAAMGTRGRAAAERRFAWEPVVDRVRQRLLALGTRHRTDGPELPPMVLDSDRALRLVAATPLATVGGRQLLRRYLRAFTVADDVCLAFPMDGNGEPEMAAYEQVSDDLGLDPDATPEVLLVPLPDAARPAALFDVADVVLGAGRPWGEVAGPRSRTPVLDWPEDARPMVMGRST